MTEQLSTKIEDDAGFWVVRMHSDQVTSDDERRFAAWLAEDVAHGAAYDRQNLLWSAVGVLRHETDNIAALADLRESPKLRGAVLSRRGLLAASLGGGALIAGGWFGWDALFGAEAYATEIGEQQRVVLGDGSTVTLNTDSALRVRFGKSERRLWLDRGQAFFSVVRDPGRPFRLFVGEDEVRAVGTAFDVRRVGTSAQVALEAGVVEVYRRSAKRVIALEKPRPESQSFAPAIVLQRGDRVLISPDTSVGISKIDARDVGAWRFGRMILDAEPLGSAVSEINRYNSQKIVLADRTLETMPINGVFQTGKPEAFVEALQIAFPVRVRSRDAQQIVLEGRETIQ